MFTHTEFTEWEEVQEGIHRRHTSNSVSNMKYGKIIEVRVNDRVYLVEPETVSKWVPVANGPLFYGHEGFRTYGQSFEKFDDVVAFLAARYHAETLGGGL